MTERAHVALRRLWASGAGAVADLDAVSFEGAGEVLPSVYPVTDAAAAAVATSTLAAARLLDERNGDGPRSVSVDRAHAAVAFASERELQIDGRPAPNLWDDLTTYYPTVDSRWVQLHTLMPHHKAGAAALLGVRPERDAVAGAIATTWTGSDLEDAFAEAGLVAALMRTRGEWAAHPQGEAARALPTIEITRIGESPVEPLPRARRPTAGVRVLDLTRIIAGPVCGRTLAATGADVLRVTSPNLPALPTLDLDMGAGKRAAAIDLNRPRDVEDLLGLVAGTDVFVQSYRPGALATRGLGPEALAARRPGLVYVSLSAYGRVGPWADRRGFDSVVQTASGIGAEGGEAAGINGPRPLPVQLLDHATGHLAAAGALVALTRRATMGGSWLVQVSLAQTAAWLDGLGRIDGPGGPAIDPHTKARYLTDLSSSSGRVRLVLPPGRIDGRSLTWPSPPPAPTDDQRWWRAT